MQLISTFNFNVLLAKQVGNHVSFGYVAARLVLEIQRWFKDIELRIQFCL